MDAVVAGMLLLCTVLQLILNAAACWLYRLASCEVHQAVWHTCQPPGSC